MQKQIPGIEIESKDGLIGIDDIGEYKNIIDFLSKFDDPGRQAGRSVYFGHANYIQGLDRFEKIALLADIEIGIDEIISGSKIKHGYEHIAAGIFIDHLIMKVVEGPQRTFEPKFIRYNLNVRELSILKEGFSYFQEMVFRDILLNENRKYDYSEDNHVDANLYDSFCYVFKGKDLSNVKSGLNLASMNKRHSFMLDSDEKLTNNEKFIEYMRASNVIPEKEKDTIETFIEIMKEFKGNMIFIPY